MNLKQIAGIGIVAVLVLLGISYGIQGYTATLPGKYDGLAACLVEKGAMFYGAFWCPHCKDQKKLFGNSAKLLPYTECSAPDGKSQLQVCVDKDIQGYPTWIFADGTRKNEILTPEQLATTVGCPLESDPSADSPQAATSTEVVTETLDLSVAPTSTENQETIE
jgi:thiol-disulfide isomerase/thioredoxin